MARNQSKEKAKNENLCIDSDIRERNVQSTEDQMNLRATIPIR
jgi:hypothetical protein